VYRRRRFYRRRPIRRVRKNRITKRRIIRPIGSGFSAKRLFKLKSFLQVNENASSPNAVVTIHDSPKLAVDFDSVAQLFDYYRVNAIKLKFIPAWTAQSLQTSISVSLRAAYAIRDINHPLDFPVTLTRNEAVGYENCKILNLQRPWTYYRKMIRNIITDPASTGIDTISIKGYYATASIRTPRHSSQTTT